MSETNYEALILGAGPAGATAAMLLARAGWHVAIVEKSPFPRRKVCGEFTSATSLPLLRELGVAEAYLAHAGPHVRRIALYEGETELDAPIPSPGNDDDGWGRALGRERLDTMLRDAAIAAGAELWQPWRAVRLARNESGWQCDIESADGTKRLGARLIIAATGSWERSPFWDPASATHNDADLLGFKAHFSDGSLPLDLMPLLVFPGGYGGLVQSDGGRVSLSCCIRRDALRDCRSGRSGRAGDAVVAHIKHACQGVRHALAGARIEGSVLSAGPIRPGLRPCYSDGVFFIGNSAGEAHPIIAEGISMAMQSAWLLCRRLISHRATCDSGHGLEILGCAYEREWRRHFALRIHAAAVFARLALTPASHAPILRLLRWQPRLLTLGARLSGKAHALPNIELYPSGTSARRLFTT